MKTSLWIAPLASVAILFGTVGAAQATGTWQTSGKTPVVVGQRLTVDELKGWMSIQQAADGLGLSPQQIIDQIGAPAGTTITPATLLKDVEKVVPGFSLAALKEKLRALPR